MSASAEVGALALAEANDSVAYSLLGELLRTSTITDEDAVSLTHSLTGRTSRGWSNECD